MANLLTGFCRNTLFRKILDLELKNVMRVQFNTFYEPDRKGGYDTEIRRKERPSKFIKKGFDHLEIESQKFIQETRQKLRFDSLPSIGHADYELFYKFNDESSVNSWIVTSDKDHNEGKSEAQFILDPNKKGLFKGYINTDVPKDGITTHSGYANVRAPKAVKSFQRNNPYDWTLFTHLILLVRGDGRPYQIVIGMDRYYDIQWNDKYSYPLYTHGGPYWQYTKIPFSKFMLTSRGRIQDKQEEIQLNRISWIGITIADGYSGPFQLEIDWIGCVYDENHKEKFAYEMYQVSPSQIS